jgi:hypothetical protein
MLSPGKWHDKVPKSLRKNLEFRKFILDKCKNARFREEVKEACKNDILFFVNTFVWQYNPNAEEGREAGPFITWDFQDGVLTYGSDGNYGLLQCIEERKDLLVEKSREMGLSWLFLIVADWMARFHRHKQFLMVSRSAEAVDSESPNSLFWKIDYLQKYLPDWLNGEVTRRKMFFGYEDSGSTITGEASTGRAGVGGRATAAFIDEFSQIKEDFELLQRTSDTTRCRIFNSTHLGLDTAFFKLSISPAIRKLKVHWTQHPEKKKGMYRWDHESKKIEILDKSYLFPSNYEFLEISEPTGGPCPGIRSPWYDEQCKRKDSARAVAMDLDINPKGSVAQFFDPMMIHTLKTTFCVPPWWVGDIHYDRESGKPLDLISSPGGPLKLWISPNDKGRPPSSVYAMGADISTGCGTTNSVISIVDAATGEKVGEYATPHIDAKDFGTIAVALAWLFKDNDGNGALTAWEIPGAGQAFGARIIELGYRNVYYRTNDGSLRRDVSDMPGWTSTPINKRLLLMDYNSALKERVFLNRSEAALEECLDYKYTSTGMIEHGGEGSGEDPTGARQNHGDRVIADALACKMMKQLGLTRKEEKRESVKTGTLAWRRQLHAAVAQNEGDW